MGGAGRDSISYHRDNEEELMGKGIMSLSVGQRRKFIVKLVSPRQLQDARKHKRAVQLAERMGVRVPVNLGA